MLQQVNIPSCVPISETQASLNRIQEKLLALNATINILEDKMTPVLTPEKTAQDKNQEPNPLLLTQLLSRLDEIEKSVKNSTQKIQNLINRSDLPETKRTGAERITEDVRAVGRCAQSFGL